MLTETMTTAAAAAYVWLYSINAGQIATVILTLRFDAAFDRTNVATAIQFRSLGAFFICESFYECQQEIEERIAIDRRLINFTAQNPKVASIANTKRRFVKLES